MQIHISFVTYSDEEQQYAAFTAGKLSQELYTVLLPKVKEDLDIKYPIYVKITFPPDQILGFAV